MLVLLGMNSVKAGRAPLVKGVPAAKGDLRLSLVIVEIRDRKRLAMRPECVSTEVRVQRTGLGRVSAGVGNEAASARHCIYLEKG